MLSWPVLGEKPPASAWLATAVGIAGVYLLSLGEGRSDPQTFSIVPILTALLASVASAIALLGLHHLKQVSTSAVVAHFSGVSLVCSGLAMLAPAKAFTSEPTSADWFLLSLVGVSATFGQLFLTKAFAAGSPAKISVISLSQVGFAMLMQIVFLGHRFNPLTVGGIALVVAPTAWVLLRRQ
jgi:drug/metabolite transporter (DMT)-like permease